MSWMTTRRVGAVLTAATALVAASGCGDEGDGSASPGATGQTTTGTQQTTHAGTTTTRKTPTQKRRTTAEATTTATTTTQAQTPTQARATTSAKTTTSEQPRTSAQSTTSPGKTATTRTPPKKRDFEPRLRVEASRFDPVRSSSLTIDVTQRPQERMMSRLSVVIPGGYGLEPVEIGRRAGESSVNLVGSGKRALLPPLTVSGDLRSAKRKGNVNCVTNPITVFKTVLKSESKSKEQTRVPLTLFIHKAGDSRRMTICLPSAAKLPGHASIRRLNLRLWAGLVPPGPGDAVWRGFFTPVAASGASAQQGTTESQGIVPLPSFLTLEPRGKTRVSLGATIRLHGVLSLNGPAARRKIQISVATDRRGYLPVGSTRTGANGDFSYRTKAPAREGLLFFQARALSHEVPCTAKSPDAPAGCTSATVSGMTSAPVRVTVAG
jgi:hypothetical protein